MKLKEGNHGGLPLLLFFFVIGCVHAPMNTRETQPNTSLQTYKAFAKVALTTKEKDTYYFNQYMFIIPPSNLRIEGSDPLGGTIFRFIASGDDVSLLIPDKNELYRGKATRETMFELTSIRALPAEIILLLTSQIVPKEISCQFSDFTRIETNDYPKKITCVDTVNNVTVELHIAPLFIDTVLEPSLFNHLKDVSKDVSILNISSFKIKK